MRHELAGEEGMATRIAGFGWSGNSSCWTTTESTKIAATVDGGTDKAQPGLGAEPGFTQPSAVDVNAASTVAQAVSAQEWPVIRWPEQSRVEGNIGEARSISSGKAAQSPNKNG
jgi:hypothetical protein